MLKFNVYDPIHMHHGIAHSCCRKMGGTHTNKVLDFFGTRGQRGHGCQAGAEHLWEGYNRATQASCLRPPGDGAWTVSETKNQAVKEISGLEIYMYMCMCIHKINDLLCPCPVAFAHRQLELHRGRNWFELLQVNLNCLNCQ